VVAKVRERLAVSKQAAQSFDGERFNLRKLNELEVRKQYQIEITNRFAALENLFRNLKLTVRSKILGTCTGTSMTLRRVTNLELI